MPQIRYEFVASGHGEVLDAIKSVERASNQAAARARAAATGRGAPGVGGGGAGPSAPAARGYKSDPQMDAYWKASVKGAQDQGRAMAKEHARQYQERERHNAKVAAAEKRASDKRWQMADKEAVKIRQTRERELDGWRKSQDAMRSAEAAKYALPTRQEWKGGAIKGVRGVATAGIAGVVGLAGTAIAAASSNIQDAVRGAMSLQEKAVRVAINARGAGEALTDPTVLRREFENVATSTPGVTGEEVADAVQKFVTLTGDLGTARKAASTFATVASATGSNVGDVAQASASISNQFGLKTNEEIKDVLTSLTFQGKQGAFELADAASQFQRLAAAGAAFGLNGAKGVKTIGGLAQIARTGTGSAEQTTTAIENIFSNLTAKSGVLKKEGVEVFDKKTGKAREVTDVLIEAIAKAGKNDFEKKSATLRQVFGDQGIRGILPLLNKYQMAFNSADGDDAKKTAAGMARLREEFEKSINAPGSWEELQKDAATAQETGTAQISKAYEQLKAAAGDQLAPAITQMVPTFTALIGASAALLPAIEDMTKYMGYGVKMLQEKGILDEYNTEAVKRNKPQSVGDAVQRKNEILAAGAPTEADVAEMADLDKYIEEGRIKTGSVDELQKRKDAIYGKGTLSAEDEATVDLIDKTLGERKKTDFERYAEQDPNALKKMTQADFEEQYAMAAPEGESLQDARTRAKVFAWNTQRGDETSDTFMRGGIVGMATGTESEEQRAIRQQYTANGAEARGEAKGDVVGSALMTSLLGAPIAIGQFVTGLGGATAALEKMSSAGQPSIIAP